MCYHYTIPAGYAVVKKVVRAKRLELIRLMALEPKSSASANSATPAFSFGKNGDPSEIRTPDPLIKSQMLYRLS